MLTRVRLARRWHLWDDYVDVIYNKNRSIRGYELLSIKGIEPPPVDVNYSEYALISGGRFHSASTSIRNIVMTIGLVSDPDEEPGGTVHELRRELYRKLPPGEQLIVMLFNEESYESYALGYLETVEPEMFSKEPTIQLSIVCPEPFFRAPEPIETGNIPRNQSRTYENNGTIPIGLVWTINISGTVNGTFTLENETTGRSMSVTGGTWYHGTVRVDTREGSKSVTKRDSSGATTEHLLSSTVLSGGWPELRPGENTLTVSGEQPSWSWKIYYHPLYSGF